MKITERWDDAITVTNHELILAVNAALEPGWTPKERLVGRRVALPNIEDEQHARMRSIYAKAGWEVYALYHGGDRYLDFRYVTKK